MGGGGRRGQGWEEVGGEGWGRGITGVDKGVMELTGALIKLRRRRISLTGTWQGLAALAGPGDGLEGGVGRREQVPTLSRPGPGWLPLPPCAFISSEKT